MALFHECLRFWNARTTRSATSRVYSLLRGLIIRACKSLRSANRAPTRRGFAVSSFESRDCFSISSSAGLIARASRTPHITANYSRQILKIRLIVGWYWNFRVWNCAFSREFVRRRSILNLYIGGGVFLVRSIGHCACVGCLLEQVARQYSITEKSERNGPAKEKAGVPSICANGYENVLSLRGAVQKLRILWRASKTKVHIWLTRAFVDYFNTLWTIKSNIKRERKRALI